MGSPNNVGINIFANEPPDPRQGTGRVFWVGATATTPGGIAGSDSAGSFGSSPQRPFATIDYAISQCTANQGDVIYVLPQHQEDIADATTFQVDVVGVSIIGLGRGTDRPQFNFTNTAGSVELDSANVRISNLMFIADVSAVVVGVNVDADYVQVDNCEFNFNATGDDFLIMIDVDDVNYCRILNCEFYAESATAGSNEAIRLDTADQCWVKDCSFAGDFAVAAIAGLGAASTLVLIDHNYIYNDDTAAAENGIDFDVANTGLISHNIIGTLRGASTVANLIDPGSCLNIENYACNAIDEKGILIPGSASA
jgi:hypothetical protein